MPPNKQLDWSIKHVQLNTDQDEAFEQIREYFDSISDEVFFGKKFPFVHFNEYSPAPGCTFAPAEFCCVTWTLDKGIVWFGGSPIDPGTETLSDWSKVVEQSRNLSLPKPPYTYNRGLGYSVGEDRYDEIAKSIFEQSATFTMPYEARPIHYIFASEDNLRITCGCMAWLLAQFDGNPRLRVLPMERFVRELNRTCQIRRFSVDLKAKVTRELQVNIKSEPSEDTERRMKYDDDVIFKVDNDSQKSTISWVSSVEFAGNVVHTMDGLDNRLRLGCLWHQRIGNCDSIAMCSTTQCKKWVYRVLLRALEILDKDVQTFVEELEKPDMNSVRWDEVDSMGLEARQRFGFFGKISDKRINLLERGFVFPDLLKELKRKMPNGMKRKPETLIWPLERDIEKDLNWSMNAVFFVHDPEPAVRAQKLAELQEERDREALSTLRAKWTVKNEVL